MSGAISCSNLASLLTEWRDNGDVISRLVHDGSSWLVQLCLLPFCIHRMVTKMVEYYTFVCRGGRTKFCSAGHPLMGVHATENRMWSI